MLCLSEYPELPPHIHKKQYKTFGDDRHNLHDYHR